ncbi:MAG: signal peptidase I [Proteobacteria bacterium]|nr:signal peptidase I [Pseudomonadota bacterium]
MKKRKPVVAFLLSFWMPGLGQLYNGALRRALARYGVYIVLIVAVVAVFVSTLPLSFAGFAVAYVLGGVLGVLPTTTGVEAFIDARKAGTVALKRFNRWYVYGALCVFQAAAYTAFYAIDLPARASLATYSIPNPSMLPNLRVGDYLVAAKGAYGERMPNRGEMVVFVHPRIPDFMYLQRVVGLPGDRISIRNGRLNLNGVVVARQRIDADPAVPAARGAARGTIYIERLPTGARYRILEESDDSPQDNTPEYVVPEGHVFVLGDNRDRSADSRMMDEIGFIPFEFLTDKPLFLYWSRYSGRMGSVIE